MSVLSQLGRPNYVSESGLASLPTELKELGQLPEQTSRTSIKRARDQAISDLSAQYGTLMKTKKIPLEGGEGELSVCFLDPVATLVTCLEQCVPFRVYMSSCLEKVAPRYDQPLGYRSVLGRDQSGEPVAPPQQAKDPDDLLDICSVWKCWSFLRTLVVYPLQCEEC